MGLANRSATCTSCGKRLSRKQWYYRNGHYYCKKRCWVTAAQKASAEAPAEPTPTQKPRETAQPKAVS